MPREPTAAQALFPHLQQGTPELVQRQQPQLAAAMYPALAPKPTPQPPAPKRKLTREEILD